MTRRVRLTVAVIFALRLGVPGWGGAAPKHRAAASPARLQVQQLTDKGLAALARRDFAVAEAALDDAYRIRPSAETLFYLGVLSFADNRILDAQDRMRRYLVDPQLDAAATQSEQGEAQRILALPRPAHGKLSVLGDPGTLIRVDGRLVGNLPLARPLLVRPGPHALTLEWGPQKQEESVLVPELRFVELRHNTESRAVLVSQLPGVLLLATYKDVPLGEQQQLSRAIEETVQSEHYTLIAREQALDTVREPEVTRCLEQTACQTRLAAQAGADSVLLATAARQGVDLSLQLQILDAPIGELAATAEKRCAACTEAQVVAALAAMLPALLLQSRNRPRGSVHIVSQPPGAEVRTATRLLGRTPLVQPLWSATQELELTLPGYLPQHRQVAIQPGQDVELQIPLQAVSPVRVVVIKEGTHRSLRPLWLGLGSAAIGGGLLSGGFGMSGLAENGSCSIPPITGSNHCLQTYQTSSVGTALAAFGGTLILGGALLVAIPELRRPKKEIVHALKPSALPGGSQLRLAVEPVQ